MDARGTEVDDQPAVDNTPRDVAALYSWAKLQGAKYRDYSAARREYRAQVRYRAAKAQLEREVQAQAEAEAAAAAAERIAVEAAAAAREASLDQGEVWRAQSILAAEKAAERAAADRVEAARRAELSARLAVVALREEREIAEAHASAKRQEMLYEGTEVRLRQLAGPQPHGTLDGENIAVATEDAELGLTSDDDLQQFLFPGWQDFVGLTVAEREPSDVPGRFAGEGSDIYRALDDWDGEDEWTEQGTPAWLFSGEAVRPEAVQGDAPVARVEIAVGETLFDSREQLAGRWPALKRVFDEAGPELAAMPAMNAAGSSKQVVAMFSLCGGVGKTSLAAAIAHGLALQGEKVALVDTTAQGLLPIYFGVHEVRAGVAHRVEVEGQSSGGSISLMASRAVRANGEDAKSEVLVEEILRSMEGNHRVVLDLTTGGDWPLRRLADLHPTMLVPIAPDINSVMSLQIVERLFRGITDSQGRSLLPLYVLNQFDASLPLHLDIREVFRRTLGDRLAQVAIRRSAAVGEALADGMTVQQYAPQNDVAQDYGDVVAWLRRVAPLGNEASRGLRWGVQ